MSIKLNLHTTPSVPLEAEVITPQRFASLSNEDIAALPVQHGNELAKLGDFFTVSGSANGEIELEGDLRLVKMIGQGMSSGRIVIAGDVGMHVGAIMSGGEIVVEGNATDWAGAEMLGGQILIRGNAGHGLGCGYRGSRIGMRGGQIFVQGNAGSETGGAMRGGLIAIGGNSGDFTGVNMRAGTIIALGEIGWRSGASMLRGSIVTMQPARILPTFGYACTYQPNFLRFYLLHLRAMGLPVSDEQVNGYYQRYSGDSIELNRGEILVFAG